MSQTADRAICVTCGKQKATFRCGGCARDFCYNHLVEHKTQLSKQLEEVETSRDLFRQSLTEQANDPRQQTLVQRIDQWEREAVEKIRKAAEDARRTVLKSAGQHVEQLEARLSRLTDQLRQSRSENDFFETDIQRWNEELKRLSEDLTTPSSIKVRSSTTPLVTRIIVAVTAEPRCAARIDARTTWATAGVTVAGGQRGGSGLNQLSNPWGLCVDDDQTVLVAEYSNNRITGWKSNATVGQILLGGNSGRSADLNHLYAPADVVFDKQANCLIIADYGNERVLRWPRGSGADAHILIPKVDCWGLALDSDRHLYVADYTKCEVRRWRVGDLSGTLVAGGNGKGSQLNQLHGRLFIFVDEERSVYVSDESNHRVVKWTVGATEGVIVAGNQTQGNGLAQLSSPKGVIVDHSGTVYVADQDNHRVMRWPKGARQGSVVIGQYGRGGQANQLFNPIGLQFDREGNLYVVDNGNSRVQRYTVESHSNI